MDISAKGIALIKKYEGCRLKAYKPVATERYWTIGWGHYGADVKAGSTITQAQADAMLLKDLRVYVNHVKALGMTLNQNQFDALVSFCYNCGAGNLQRLCSDRSIASINRWITEYNKGGGKVLTGLVHRRAEEKVLFNTPVIVKISAPKPKPVANQEAKTTKYRVTVGALNIRATASNSGKIIGELAKGNTVQVIKIVGGWAHIKSGSKTVYVGAKHIKKA